MRDTLSPVKPEHLARYYAEDFAPTVAEAAVLEGISRATAHRRLAKLRVVRNEARIVKPGRALLELKAMKR